MQLAFPQTLPSIHYAIPHLISREQCAKITSVALFVLKKFGQALVINVTIRCAFSAFMVPQFTVVAGVVSVALTAFIVAKIALHFFQRSNIPIFFDSLVRSTLVTSLTLKLNNIIHEYGHALAAKLSFIDARPEVIVNYNEGSTSYVISNGLTRFGKLLGEQRAILFITAAGLISPIFCTITEFAIAHGLSHSCPNLSDILIDHGFSQLAQGTYYGISAFFTYEGALENDFIRLWQLGGIHPLLSITLMLALPLAEICLLKYWSLTHQKG